MGKENFAHLESLENVDVKDETVKQDVSPNSGPEPKKRSASPNFVLDSLRIPIHDPVKDEIELPKKRQRTVESNGGVIEEDIREPSVGLEPLNSLSAHEIVKKYEEMSEEEARTAMNNLSNPRAVIKKEKLFLDDKEILKRLEPAGLDPFPVVLDPAIRDTAVTRSFISKHFGGTERETFPRIKPGKLATHGYDNLMCINLLYAPYAPKKPGYPGLFFQMTPAVEPWSQKRSHTQVLFVRLRTNEWLYVGLYQQIAVASLTPEEWHSQDASVRKNWSKEIAVKKWAKPVRVSIHLKRRLGRAAVEEEIDARVNDGSKYDDVTEEDVLDAYDKGDEIMGVWCMKCVGYDENFQRGLIKAARRNGRR
ncbi:hypothetical protein BKA93DRAFT_311282 [Sparassis latifolia]